MRFFAATALILAIVVSIEEGHSQHGFDHTGHEPVVSYALVINHQSFHDDHIHSPHKHSDEVPVGHKDHHQKHYYVHEDNQEHNGHEDQGAHAKYEFKYGVNDMKSCDMKDHGKFRDNDKVKGGYSLVVNYAADKTKGFQAVVQKHDRARQGLHTHVYYKMHGHPVKGWAH